jgi:phosphoglycolate phosphatase
MQLALFDIDGTLISANGAGMRALYQAFQLTFDLNVKDGIVQPDGKTDPLIVKELMSYLNITDRWDPNIQQRLFSYYREFLEVEIGKAKELGYLQILPGVLELLRILSEQQDFAIGLATGNLEQGARIKLEKVGLNHFFRFGGFGSDSEDRTVLTRIGIQRGIREIAPASFESVCVIGDTPFDIMHGHAADACVIAVASAKYSMDELRRYNPDLLVSDLTDATVIINFIRSAGSRLF